MSSNGNDDVKENGRCMRRSLFTRAHSGNIDTGASTDSEQPPRIVQKSASDKSDSTPVMKSSGDDIRGKGRDMLLSSFKKYGRCAVGINANET